MKACSKCGISKSPTEFSKDLSSRDGLFSSCKACHKIITTAYCNANREKINLASAIYRTKNPEKCKAACAAYRAANSDKEKARSAAWYANNLEKTNTRVAAWKAANPEKVKADAAAWAKANSDVLRVRSQNRRALKHANGGKLSVGLAESLFKLQHGKCPCCGKPLGDNYHLDHIMPLALGGSNTDDNIQLLRATCNHQKHAKHPIDFMQSRGFLL